MLHKPPNSISLRVCSRASKRPWTKLLLLTRSSTVPLACTRKPCRRWLWLRQRILHRRLLRSRCRWTLFERRLRSWPLVFRLCEVAPLQSQLILHQSSKKRRCSHHLLVGRLEGAGGRRSFCIMKRRISTKSLPHQSAPQFLDQTSASFGAQGNKAPRPLQRMTRRPIANRSRSKLGSEQRWWLLIMVDGSSRSSSSNPVGYITLTGRFSTRSGLTVLRAWTTLGTQNLRNGRSWIRACSLRTLLDLSSARFVLSALSTMLLPHLFMHVGHHHQGSHERGTSQETCWRIRQFRRII